jgi:hypothetical protein
MPLPKIEYPVYEIYVKSLDKKIPFRPYLVKEEKILLMAKEAKDADSIRLAIKQVIQNCAVGELDVESLPLFDVEMIFLKLRAKSVGESVKLVFNCKNEIDGKVCDTNTDYVLDLAKIDYEIPEGHDSKIMITDKVGIKLKYPSLGTTLDLDEDANEYTVLIASLLVNIEYIFDEESVYKPDNATKEEVAEFLSNLKEDHLYQIRQFYESSPKVVLNDTVKCKACGFVHTLHAENLLDFFT